LKSFWIESVTKYAFTFVVGHYCTLESSPHLR